MRCFSLLVGGVCLAAVSAFAGEMRDFGNWHVVCDNGGSCVALGDAENSAEPAYVSIVLRAGEAQPASVGLMFGALDDTQARRRDLSAAFEGQVGGPVPRTTDTARQTEDDFFRFRLPAGRTVAFVERVAAGGVLRLELSAANAPYYSASIDLGRAKEALDWVRNEAPRPTALPVLHVKTVAPASGEESLPDAVRKALPEGCAAGNGPKTAPDTAVMRVSERAFVWRVYCAEAAEQRFFLFDKEAGSATPLTFTRPNQMGDPAEASALGPKAYLDEASMAIRDEMPVNCPNAGLAGDQQEWVWTGARFELALVRSAPICLDTGDWPVLYRAEVVTDR